MGTALSGVQVAPVHVDVSAPGRKTFLLATRACGKRLAVERHPLREVLSFGPNPAPTSSWASGCRLPPDQFFGSRHGAEQKSPGWPDVYVVSVVVSADTPFCNKSNAPPGPASSRSTSPAAPALAALVNAVISCPGNLLDEIVVVFRCSYSPGWNPPLPESNTDHGKIGGPVQGGQRHLRKLRSAEQIGVPDGHVVGSSDRAPQII